MRVAAAMILLLCCGVVASAAAVNNDVALADDDAALKGEVASLRTRLVAMERRASERDPVTPEGQKNLTNRQLLIDIKDAFARWGTPKCSDSGGQLQLLMGQISERVTQMGTEIWVLKAQSTADAQTLSRNGAEIRALKIQSTADAQTLSRNEADIRAFKTQSTADAQTLSRNGAEIRVLKTQSTADAQTLQKMTRQLELTSQNGAGASTFVRWGSSTCGAGNASSLVYSGVVGGGHYSLTGAAVNYLCLTLSPRLSQQAVPTVYAILYGAEYETQDSHQNKNPVCAVCRAAFSTTVMIPGTDTCTPGWRLQYSGFLMAGRVTHKAGTEYICVDHALESAHRSVSNQDGALLYFTKTQCGSLLCAPYANTKIVTCAVCSK